MKGYRCDNCLDFAPPRLTVPRASVLKVERASAPKTWVTLERDEQPTAHFCSPACVAAWATKEQTA